MNEIAKTATDWIPVFLPILGIGLGVTIAVTLINGVGKGILNAFKWDSVTTPHTDEELHAYGQQKLLELIADGTLTIERVQSDEVEKPKNGFIVADDGELLEVINDDKPKRGVSHDG